MLYKKVGMEIELDRERLKEITGIQSCAFCPKYMKAHKDRILGMIKNGVMFSAVISGYRGTGKSSFVKSVINDIPKNAIPITINAAKPEEYGVFVKRFIREIYFGYKGKAPEYLENLFLHTFCDVKNQDQRVYSEENSKTEKSTKTKEKKRESKINYGDVLGWLFELILSFGLPFLLNKLISGGLSPRVIVIAFLVIFVVCNLIKYSQFIFTSTKTHEQENQTEKTNKEDTTHNTIVETLFDGEIAEYQLFKTMERVSKDNKYLLFVLDEVDKISDKDLRELLTNLKPIILSNYCSTIVVAGRNMDSMLNDQIEEDAVLLSLFSQQIYMPLASISENKGIVYDLLKDKKSFSNSLFQKWLNHLLVDAWGNKRRLINSILDNAHWEGENVYLYIEYSEKDLIHGEIYKAISDMEDHIFVAHKGKEADKILYRMYGWVDRLRRFPRKPLSLSEIMNKENGEIDEKEKCECISFLTYLKDSQLIIESKDKYLWIQGEHINDNEEGEKQKEPQKPKEEGLSAIIHYSQDTVACEKLALKFAQYNNAGISDCREAFEYFDELLGLEVKLNSLLARKEVNSWQYRGALKGINIEPFIAAELLKWTIVNKTSFKKVLDDDLTLSYRQNKVWDASLTSEKDDRTIIVEVKYSKEYRVGYETRLIDVGNEMMEYVLREGISFGYLVWIVEETNIYSDKHFKEDVSELNKSCGENVRIYPIRLSFFSRDMDRLLDDIRKRRMVYAKNKDCKMKL